MAGPRLVSDLVRDSKIETEWLDSCLRHIFYDTGPSAKQRRVRREERWVRQKFVGQGAYGRVYLEQCEHGSSQKLRAVKEIKKAVTLGEDLDYMRELEAVAKFSNQKYSHCFVRSYGWFELEDSIFISMEYLVNGDLQRYLTAPMKEYEARQITSQVLEGLAFMHDNGFVHRDLKPGNIMVVSKDPEWFVKITGFGVSKRRQQDVTTLHTMQRGTFGFVAPEVLELLPEKSSSYTFAVDMWSLGAVVYRILTNTTAFQNVAELFKFSNGMSAFPMDALEKSAASKEGQDFVLQLMKPNPKDRLSAELAAHHSWILGNSQNSLTSNGTLSRSETIKLQKPLETNQIPDSIASKAWSMDSDIVAISGIDSSSTGVEAVTTGKPEPSVAAAANHIESSDLDTTIEPPVSEARAQLEYAQPFIDDVTEDGDLRPKLAADTPSALQTMRASDIPFVSKTVEAFKPEAPPTDLDSRVTIGTLTAQNVEIQDGETLTNTFNGSVEHQEDRIEDSPDESNITMQDSSDNDIPGATDQSTSAEVSDDNESTGNSAMDDIPDENIDTHSVTSDPGTHTHPDQSRWGTFPGLYSAVCNHCRTGLIFRYDSPEVSQTWSEGVNPCGHWLCNKCLIQHISLSLVSPGYMPPRCCTMPQGVIDIRSSRFDLEPKVTKAWVVLKQLPERARGGFWTCSRGHRPSRRSLYVTKELPAVWNKMVNCDICAEKSLPLETSYLDLSRVSKTHYCLYCRRLYDDPGCHCHELEDTIRKFVTHPQVKDQFTEDTSTIINKALDTRDRINGLQPMDYISFDEMWNHRRFLEVSEENIGQERDVDDHSVSSGPMDELETVSSDFNTWLLPQCVEFSANPPKYKEKCEAEHRRLSWMIEQHVLLKLDQIEVGGDLDIRAKRKQLVNQVQTVLKGIDLICQKIL